MQEPRYTHSELAQQSAVVADVMRRLTEEQDLLTQMMARNAVPALPASGPPRLKNSSGKLTDHGVGEMYRMFAEGARDSQVADRFEISQSAVHSRRKTWRRDRRSLG